MKQVNIDLTDVAVHARCHDRITGIQRVQLEVSRCLLKREKVRAFSISHGWQEDLTELVQNNADVPTRCLYQALKAHYRNRTFFKLCKLLGSAPLPLLERTAHRLSKLFRQRKVNYADFGPADVVFVGGAFWSDPGSLPLYEAAAANGATIIVLIHDVIPLTFPHFTNGGARPMFERLMQLPLHVIANSEFTRADFVQALATLSARPPLSIVVVPLAHELPGTARNSVPAKASSRLVQQLRQRSFVLTVGTVEIRKNHKLLLDAWDVLAKEGSDVPVLVVAGARGWMADDTVQRLTRNQCWRPYLFIDEPTDDELQWLYSSCAFTVFASAAEGWGLPVGESLWLGKPCIALRRTSVPEVGGSLCRYVEEGTAASFAAEVQRYWRDGTAQVVQLSEISTAQLRTWNEAAADIADRIDRIRNDELT